MEPSFLDLVEAWAKEAGLEVFKSEVDPGSRLEFHKASQWFGTIYSSNSSHFQLWSHVSFSFLESGWTELNPADPEVFNKISKLLDINLIP